MVNLPDKRDWNPAANCLLWKKATKKQKLTFEQRFRARLERSKPVAEAFFTWAKAECEKSPVPKSMLGAALIYAVRQESWLMNVFLDGRLELSNNRMERTVRPFALGRKNWLFSNTPKGVDASAAIYSIYRNGKSEWTQALCLFVGAFTQWL